LRDIVRGKHELKINYDKDGTKWIIEPSVFAVIVKEQSNQI